MTERKLIIAYHPASNGGLSFRGTETSLWDFMHFAENILGHKSILCLKDAAFNEPLVLEKFKNRFDTIVWYKDSINLEKKLIELKVDGFYTIRSGYQKKEEPFLTNIPMLIHYVYVMIDEGLVSAGVSQSVSKDKEFVPHMVNLYETKDDFRELLGIPKEARVFGRHGGADTWDLLIAKEALIRVLNKHPDIYFIFAVRPLILRDFSHPRVICLEIVASTKTKRMLINTCDAMLHAQSLGETFGISIAEFSMADKPVIVWDGGRCQEHLRILGDKCIKYNTTNELYTILSTFNPTESRKKDWKAYQDYLPEIVMKKFDTVFLGKLKGSNSPADISQ